MLFDAHLHTKFSADSQMLIEDAIARANQENLGLVLTEHLDYDYPGDYLFEFDPNEYFAQYGTYRSKQLHLGVEVGMQSQTAQKSKQFVEKAPFDQVICSLHLLNGQDLFYEHCYTKDQHQVYFDYLSNMLSLIKQHDFADILGHIDYICRYATYEQKDIIYDTYHELIDQLWLTILDLGIVPELNTRRFNNPHNIPILLKLYERYHDLGGKYISIGSDAHKPQNIGFAFKTAYELSTHLQLQPVYFSERKMLTCKL